MKSEEDATTTYTMDSTSEGIQHLADAIRRQSNARSRSTSSSFIAYSGRCCFQRPTILDN